MLRKKAGFLTRPQKSFAPSRLGAVAYASNAKRLTAAGSVQGFHLLPSGSSAPLCGALEAFFRFLVAFSYHTSHSVKHLFFCGLNWLVINEKK